MQENRLQNLAIAYIALWSVSPPLFASPVARALVLAATTVWVVTELHRRNGIFFRPTLPVLLTFAFVAYTGFVEFLLTGPGGLLRHIQIWIMLLFLVIYQSRRNDLQSLRSVFWFVLAVLPVWLLITIKTVLFDNPHAARIVIRSSKEADVLVQQGVGGYSLVYGAILLLPTLLVLLMNRSTSIRATLPKPLAMFPRVAQALLLLNLALSVILILVAGFSIAVVTMASVLFLVLFLRKYSQLRVITAVLASFFFVVWAPILLESFLTAVLPYAKGTNFAIKIDDMLRSLQLGEAVGSAGDRLERYMRSIRAFADAPLTGTLVFDPLGKHSEVLDAFARWGIFMGGVFLYLVTFLPFRVLRASKTRFGVGLAMLAAVTFTFGLNSGFASAGLMLYLMFPVASHMLKQLEDQPNRRVGQRGLRPTPSLGR